MHVEKRPNAVDGYAGVRRAYLAGLFTSSLGGGMVGLTSSFLISQQTKRASDVALIIVLSNIPSLLLPTVATRLAQRWGGPKLYLAVWGTYYSLGLVPFALGLAGHLSAGTLLLWYLLLLMLFNTIMKELKALKRPFVIFKQWLLRGHAGLNRTFLF